MKALLHELRSRPLLWLVAFVPILFACHTAIPEAHTLHFVLSVVAIVPLAALLGWATEAVAAKTGDLVGGLLNATLGNLTELVIALTALSAGQYMLVKASIAGAIVTNVLFMLGGSMLLGGLKHRVQTYNKPTARLQTAMLLAAIFALLVPSAIATSHERVFSSIGSAVSLALAAVLLVTYCLAMLFSLVTHREVFATAHGDGHDEAALPIAPALAVLAGVTVLVAAVSEVFVSSVQHAAETFGMTPAFVGLVVVPLVGGAAEMGSSFSAARKDRLDMSMGICIGSAAQIALFLAPVLVFASPLLGPAQMDLQFWPGAIVMMLMATLTATVVTNSGQSAWFLGVQLLTVYAIFAITLYLLPP